MKSLDIPWRALLDLMKWRIVLLLASTAVVGMFLATEPAGMVPLAVLAPTIFGLVLTMLASAGINQIAEQHIDAIMRRTCQRPLVKHRLDVKKAIVLVSAMALAGLVLLYVYVNPLTAWLTFFGFVGYSFVYTLCLKPYTSQNIVIGGIAGAIPPLLGWTAVTDHVSAGALVLLLVIFLWTPAHFWPLAIVRVDDYRRADIPMLPLTHGIAYTQKSILAYSALLTLASLLPFMIGISGYLYLVSALVLDGIFVAYAIQLCLTSSKRVAMHLFRYSIGYLYALFLALLLDHYLSGGF